MISASGNSRAVLLSILSALLLAGCQSTRGPTADRLQQPAPIGGSAPRISGAIPTETPRTIFEDRGSTRSTLDARRTSARAADELPPGVKEGGPADVTLKFADTDIREIARVILGNTLKLNYTIDPGVRGTATLETANPVRRSELLPMLEVVLNQNGATLVRRGGLYAVVPAGAAEAAKIVASAQEPVSGSQVVPLRYASAKDLAKLLEPYVAEGSTLVADPLHNALIVAGEPSSREALLALIRAFDIDALAGQSFAILPTGGGDPEKMAGALEKALRAQAEGPLSGVVQVIPLPRVSAVLVASAQPRYLDAAKRFFRLTTQAESATERTWHVYYVQHGHSADLENVLQRAFTPRHVTSSAAPGATAPGADTATLKVGFDTGGAAGAARVSTGTGATGGATSSITSISATTAPGLATSGGTPATPPAASEPLSEPSSGGRGDDENRLRIVANRTNNALLIYATASEYSGIERMLQKVDIVPMQVLINAIVAEVTLNDNLQYGTQFFFKLANLSYSLGATPTFPPTALTSSGLVGFAMTHAPDFILRALSDVTRVKVLSAPQLLVMDNEPARLQVGKQVPILTATSTSTLTAGAPIVNNVEYRPTGVILQVVPRISSRGLVTLDIAQEVSDVSTPAANTTTSSPTFQDRLVRTRVAVRDGQTVALAGLISDSLVDENSGIPFLKDVPVLGTLMSFQSSARTRTELLVLIKPQIIQDQRDAYALTEDLRQQLTNAALIPQQLSRKPLRGSDNPHGL
jgi:general secretion pathway protein D